MKVVVAYFFLFFGLGTNYLFNVIVARMLGADNFGVYSYAINLFNIFAYAAVSGLDEAALKFIPQSKNKDAERSAIQVLAFFSAIIFFCIFCIVINLFFKGEVANVSYIFAFSLPLLVILAVNSAILQANHIVGPRMAFRYALEPLVKMGFFFLVLQYCILIYVPAYAFFAALFVTNGAMIFCFKSRLFLHRFNVTKNKLNELLKYVAPLILYNAINVASGKLDVLILGAIAAAVEVGQYSAAFQTAAMLAIVLQGIETVYAPIFSSHVGNNDFKSLNADYKKALRWTMLICSPVLIDFLIFPELPLMPFGNEFLGAVPILVILCFGQFINLASGSANAILLAMGKTKTVLFISVVFISVTLFAAWIGAYLFGARGVALGVVFTIAVTNFLRIIFVYNLTECHPFSVGYFKIIAAFFISLLVGFVCGPVIGYLGVVIYPLLLITLIICFGLNYDDKQIFLKFYRKMFKI